MMTHNGQSEDTSTQNKVPVTNSPLDKFDLNGWIPNPNLTDDENYMDIVFLITRSAKTNGLQGHMGSLVVRPSMPQHATTTTTKDETPQEHSHRILSNILGAATNIPLFGTKEVTSDIHAEISALGQACQSCHSTTHCTVYITIPPCKRCFAALVAFGIGRVVTRQPAPKLLISTAASLQQQQQQPSSSTSTTIRLEHFTPLQNRQQMERINQLVNPDKSDEQLMELTEQIRINRHKRRQANKEKTGTTTTTTTTTPITPTMQSLPPSIQ